MKHATYALKSFIRRLRAGVDMMKGCWLVSKNEEGGGRQGQTC